MKKVLLSLVAVSACMVLLSGCGSKSGADASLDQVKKKGFFIVGLDDAFPPMGFREKGSDEIVGFDIDLAKKAAEKLGVKVQFKPVAWDGVVLSLNKGDIDVIWNGLTITPEREKQIAFSKPYLDNRQIIVVKTASAVISKADLKGKTVGLQLGSSSENALNADKATVKILKEIKKYSDNQLALLDLAAGRVDAVIVDEIVGRYNIAKKPGVYRVLLDNVGTELYGVGFRKTDVSFTAALNAALDEMKKDGSADAISKKWFGEAIIKK
jgi:polar amino acid transport system substrate-binding protein